MCFHLPYTFDMSSGGGSASSHAAVGITLKIISVNKPPYDLQVENHRKGGVFWSRHGVYSV